MGSNINQLENSIAYQSKLISSLDSVIQSSEKLDMEHIYYSNREFRFNELPNWRGLGFPGLEDISFESAKINGVIGELNIETTQLIARAYQNQDSYSDFSKNVNNKLLDIDSETKVVDVFAIFELVKYDVLSTENWLVNELKRTKEKLENIKRNKEYGVDAG